MTVLHVSTATGLRGGEQQALYLLAELRERGLEQVLACPRDSALWQRAAGLGVATHALPARRILRWRSLRGWVRAWGRSHGGAEARGALVAHAHDGHAHTCLWLANLLAAGGPALPFVVSRRVARAPRRPRWPWGKYAHPALRSLLCVSRAVAALHREGLGARTDIRVVYDAVAPDGGGDLATGASVDTERARRALRDLLGVSPDTPVVGTVAALTPEKDAPVFVEACARVARALPGVHFVHVGGGTARQRAGLLALAGANGLGTRLHALGFRDDALRLLGGFDVFAFASRWEGLGSSLLQAQLRGVPAVSTRAGGTPEVIEHGRTGLLVDVGDAAGLARGVERLLREPALARRLAAAGRAHARAFSVARMAADTLDAYEHATR